MRHGAYLYAADCVLLCGGACTLMRRVLYRNQYPNQYLNLYHNQ